MPETKTVYILGAGASASAKLPTQAQILPLIFSISREPFSNIETNKDFLALEINTREHRMKKYYTEFDKYRMELGNFIVSNFSTSDRY